MHTEMSTIPKTHERLHADGYPISMRALRIWVQNGDIPSVVCGNRPYVWYPNVIEFLQKGNSAVHTVEPPVAEVCGIRKVS